MQANDKENMSATTAPPGMTTTDQKPASPQPEGDDYTLIGPRKPMRQMAAIDDGEPLVDKTEKIPLNSKKTARMQKKKEKKLQKTTVVSETQSFLDLPAELLHEVLGYLRPTDVFRLLRLNKSTRDYILDNESLISKDIILHRYHTLSRSFHLPVALSHVDSTAQAALLSKNWQDRLAIHKKPYGHVREINATQVCTCMSCMLAWNNLNIILDFDFFQPNLNHRDPIPMIPRGTRPKWNNDLIERNASKVEKAIRSPLAYAAILQIHLNTIIGTLTRQVRVGKKTCHPRRLFHLSTSDIDSGTDRFLERSGPPSYEFPFHRDNYYSLEAYVPNRKWDKEEQAWTYATPGKPHENDLAWVVARFTPELGKSAADQGLDQFVSDFASRVQV